MHAESPKNDIAKKNLNALCDMELILGLPCLLPLFICVHKLIKIVQGWNVFICNIVEAIKLAQLELYMLYCHIFTKFEDVAFDVSMQLETWQIQQCRCNGFLTSMVESMHNTLQFFSGQKYLIYSSCIEGAIAP
jgi:hypothetical protein